MRYALAGFALAIGLAWLLVPRAADSGVDEVVGSTMGTRYSVRVPRGMPDAALDEMSRVAAEQLDRLERLMSTYDAGSELSRFNAHRGTDAFPVDAELAEVVALALEVSERTDGAFDPTVVPWVEAWGFGAADEVDEAPDSAELARLAQRVGYRSIVVDTLAGTLTKDHPELGLDLSGIAKGYAANEVADAVIGLGFAGVLVDVGGELKAMGDGPDGRPWRVGLQWPEPGARRSWGAVELVDEAIATSGDTQNAYTVDGVRRTHLIDPRTGEALEQRGFSVSVIHDDGAVADAWATALAVLGPEEGQRVAQRSGIGALFLFAEGGGRLRASSWAPWPGAVEGWGARQP